MSRQPRLERFDIIVAGGVVLQAGDGYRFEAKRADVGVAGGRIAAIGDLAHASASSRVDAAGGIVIPGFVNGHLHSYSAPFPGMGAGMTLADLIAQARSRVARHSDEARYVAAKWSALQMLKHGITTVLDQPAQGVSNPSGTAQGYADVGIRAFVAPMVSDLGYEGWLPAEVAAPPATAQDTDELVAEVAQFMDWLMNTSNRVRPAAGPFAPGVCSDQLLVALIDIAAERGLPIHTHLDEAPWQHARSFEKHGVSTVRRLADLELLRPEFSMAHAIWLDEEDFSILVEHGCSIVHNPLSNLLLGNGIAKVEQARRAGVNVALGSDGVNAGCTFDFFEHMRLAAGLLITHATEEPRHTEDLVLWMATAGGATALAVGDDLGRLVEGALADVVVLRPTTPQRLSLEDVVRAVVYGGAATHVSEVLVDGELVVSAGRITRFDEDELALQLADVFATNAGEADQHALKVGSVGVTRDSRR